VTSATNPYFTTADSTYGTTLSTYDGLGRIQQVTKPDGSKSFVTYNDASAGGQGICTTTTDEAGKQRRTCSDALGRLVEVDESNPGAAATKAWGTVPLAGTLQSHTTSGSAAVKAGATVNIWSGDGSGGDMHIDDPSEPCPPLPQTCQQIYDSGWVAVFINGIGNQVNYSRFTTSSSLASSLVSAINSSGANVYVTATVTNGSNIFLQAKNAGAAGNSITVSATSATNDPGDFGFSSFGGNLIGSTLTGGADAVSPVTIWDQGTVTFTIGSFTASAPYSQSGNSTVALIATALAGTGSTGLNRAGSPVSAVANNGSLTITYATGGTAGNGVAVSTGSQSTQTQWTFTPSFNATGTALANALPAGDVSNNPLITQYQYDALGNLLCVEQHGTATSTAGCSELPSADATNPWRIRRFTYDTLSRLTTASNPETNTVPSGTSYIRVNSTYTYDANGNLLQKGSLAPNQTGSTIQTVNFCYDELNRVVSKGYGTQSCPMTTPVVIYVYDSGPNAKGHLTSLTDQAGTASYTYDNMGRLATETRILKPTGHAQVSKTLSYEYNLDGSLSALHYPSTAKVTYAAGTAGLTLSAVDSGNNVQYATGATYGPDAGLTGFLSGHSATFAGITNAYTYNKRFQPLTMSATAPSQTVYYIGYDFHAGNGTAGTGTDNGNVFGIINYKDTTHNRDQTFTYDVLNRLTSAQNAGTDCAAMTVNAQPKTKYWGNSYGYDAWGNLLNKTVTKCGAENLVATVSAANNNQLGGSYHYDSAGNMTVDPTDGITLLTYDQENRLTGANGSTYTYDADGNRVIKSSSTTGTLYWAMTPGIVAESDLSGNTTSEYVFFDGERVARRDGVNGAGGVFYYFSDHLKTASVITDAAGNIKAESDYYPWGGELQFTNNDTNHYKFTGKERDSETGLDNFGARYYGSALGRFVTPDWSAKPVPVPYAELGDPQSLNQYAYVRNNPLSKNDPDGHCGAPAGLKPGQTGVCVASYIQTKWFKAPGRGDGRGPNPNGGTSRVESRIVVDTQQHSATQTYDHVGRSGIGGQDVGLKGSGGSTVSSTQTDKEGNTYFQVSQHGESAMKSLTFGLVIDGTIDNHLNLAVTPDGKVGIDPGSTARDFPSLEVYSYSMDDKGNVTSTQILDRREASPNDKNGDLGHPEKPIKEQEPK
jgi:RHS repeat-associated protein